MSNIVCTIVALQPVPTNDNLFNFLLISFISTFLIILKIMLLSLIYFHV